MKTRGKLRLRRVMSMQHGFTSTRPGTTLQEKTIRMQHTKLS
ncbi:hypothetical protein PAMC26577_21770 [Caballeronia sordidicola]|uniref:Uncharacterized protein n=1 Tax=Caballeronia sordidicola TaxID=196367 RepID=A0A242MLC3_CABSO|nr:hypothetical protein PAMC26577_21770 [Caballeronia sordidicola]